MALIKTAIVVPNWNGRHRLPACLGALEKQSQSADIVVVENGSDDGSSEFIDKSYVKVILLQNPKNLGFTGGVNTGIRYALKGDYKYVALLNNDAVADKIWLEHLVSFLENNPRAGIVTSKILADDGKHLDSTGDIYTSWGLPFPRGRGEVFSNKYDSDIWVFGASGGASLYRAKMLEEIGLFDEDFFAYYEDVDISFRAQLAGWKIGYEPKAVVYHKIGATSSKIKGFATYQTIKNLPWLLWKNVPTRLLLKVLPRFYFAYLSFILSALARLQFGPVTKGLFVTTLLWPKKLVQRFRIQNSRKVPADYISSILVRDLPPNAYKLRALRSKWWKLRGKE